MECLKLRRNGCVVTEKVSNQRQRRGGASEPDSKPNKSGLKTYSLGTAEGSARIGGVSRTVSKKPINMGKKKKRKKKRGATNFSTSKRNMESFGDLNLSCGRKENKMARTNEKQLPIYCCFQSGKNKLKIGKSGSDPTTVLHLTPCQQVLKKRSKKMQTTCKER